MSPAAPSPSSNKPSVRRPDFFLLAMEYGGEHVMDVDIKRPGDVDPNYYVPGEDIETIKSLGLCNGFRIFSDPDAPKLSHAQDGGYGAMIDFWLTEGRLELFAKNKGLTLKPYIDQTVDLMMDYMKRHGARFWWNIWPEICNPGNPYNVGFYPEKCASRKEWYDFLKDHFTTDKFARHRTEQCITRFDPYIGFKKPAIQYLRERGIDPAEVNLSALAIGNSMCHHFFDWGITLVQAEVWGARHQVASAFLRGAARQYNGAWGFDVAPYASYGGGLLQLLNYDSQGRKLAGVSESILLRAWLVGFLSGANYITEQASSVSNWVRNKKTSGKQLSRMGRTARDFADFALRRHSQRGEPYTPVALVLEQYHGWDCPQYGGYGCRTAQACHGRVPYEKKDEMITAFFAHAFPGCVGANRFLGGEWAANGSWEKQAPWLNKILPDQRAEVVAKQKALQAGLDTRPYEMAATASTWGDSYDVFIESVSLERLQQYPVVILLGGVNLGNPGIRAKCRAYVEAGGRLMVNIAQVRKEDESFLGVRLTGNKNPDAWQTHCLVCGRRYNVEYAFNHEIIEPLTAEVLARAEFYDDQKGHPLVTRNKVGKGEVIFTVPDFWLDDDPRNKAATGHRLDLNPLCIIRDTLDHLIAPLMLVEVKGRPIQWLVNLADKGKIVTLLNNSAEPWDGEVVIKEMDAGSCLRELWIDKNIPDFTMVDGQISLKAHINPFEFTILGAGGY